MASRELADLLPHGELEIIAERPFVWGTFVWNMFDFGAAHRTEGDRPGINDKGLVTFDRKVRKDAFYFYKANWNKQEPMIYLAENAVGSAISRNRPSWLSPLPRKPNYL